MGSRGDFYKGERKKRKKIEKKTTELRPPLAVSNPEPEVVPKGKAAKPREEL